MGWGFSMRFLAISLSMEESNPSVLLFLDIPILKAASEASPKWRRWYLYGAHTGTVSTPTACNLAWQSNESQSENADLSETPYRNALVYQRLEYDSALDCINGTWKQCSVSCFGERCLGGCWSDERVQIHYRWFAVVCFFPTGDV